MSDRRAAARLIAGIVFSACMALRPAAAAPYAAPDDPALAATEHVCSSCHGIAGLSVSPEFPRLAGQQKDYIVAQLKAYRAHQRADPGARTYMWGVTALLSDSMIDALAVWYSAQAPASGQSDDPAKTASGKRIYSEGLAEQGIPACNACHSTAGEGAGAFPRLAGQHRDYLALQLANFASGTRANEVMSGVAMGLTPEQIADIATYLSAISAAKE